MNWIAGRQAVAGTLGLLLGASCAFSQANKTAGGAWIEDVGRLDFRDEQNSGATQLSGLTYSGEGNVYYAVSDKTPRLYKLEIDLSQEAGAALGMVRAVRIVRDDRFPLVLYADDRKTPFAQGPDREACAYDPASRSVWIGDEGGGNLKTHPPQFRNHSPETGATLRPAVTVLSDSALGVFRFARAGCGFESLTRLADGSGYWSAGEEALSVDGAAASSQQGSRVRLVRFDANFKCLAQYAYSTDPIAEPTSGRFDRSGVSDACALPDNTLLVLERSFSLAGWRSRIYAVDTAGATDVSKGVYAAGLKNRVVQEVKKTLLFDRTHLLMSISNFESLCLGPVLPDGSRSLLMLADNNGGAMHSVYALRVQGLGKR